MKFLCENSGLWAFACKKLFSCLFSLWIIITLTFFLMKVVPGDPLTQEKALSEEVYQGLYAYYGFDKPLYKQYFDYLENILSLNLGPSLIHTGRTATQVIVEGFPVSGLLGLEALAIAFFVGVSAGVLSALKKNTWTDTLVLVAGGVLLSIPSFILGSLFQYVIGIQCGWLPVARWGEFSHTIMPAVALAAMPAAFLAKLVRANMSDVLKQDYIFLARTKGLPMKTVILKHALRNALIPLFGYFGKMSANIFVGSFVIEKIFCIPGLGYWLVSSIGNRDYPMIMGLTIFYSIVLLGAIFLADMGHALVDSRVYRQKESYSA